MRTILKNGFSFAIFAHIAVLTGCASTAKEEIISKPNLGHLQSLIFKNSPPPQIETVEQIFSVSPEMKQYVSRRFDKVPDANKRVDILAKDFFSSEQLNLSYVHNANLTAAETFQSKTANCVSLSILAYVLSTEARLEPQFKYVDVPENWVYKDGISMLNEHVNVTITSLKSDRIAEIPLKLTIDFFKQETSDVINTFSLNKNEMTALYYNNKGADALINRNNQLAFWYFKKAIEFGPAFSSPWVNLGVLLRRFNLQKEAETAFKYAIAIDDKNSNALENLAFLYKDNDKKFEARKIMAQLQKVREKNPYYHAMLGELYYEQKKYQRSIDAFNKALEMKPDVDSFKKGLVKSYKAFLYEKNSEQISNSINLERPVINSAQLD